MMRKIIIAPSQFVAGYYCRKNNIDHKATLIIVSRFEADKLRGLRKTEVTVINESNCNEELIAFAKTISPVANLKLEFVNV